MKYLSKIAGLVAPVIICLAVLSGIIGFFKHGGLSSILEWAIIIIAGYVIYSIYKFIKKK